MSESILDQLDELVQHYTPLIYRRVQALMMAEVDPTFRQSLQTKGIDPEDRLNELLGSVAALKYAEAKGMMQMFPEPAWWHNVTGIKLKYDEAKKNA